MLINIAIPASAQPQILTAIHTIIGASGGGWAACTAALQYTHLQTLSELQRRRLNCLPRGCLALTLALTLPLNLNPNPNPGSLW